MTRYLAFKDILRQVDRAGFVVRDPGLLASAVARPETTVFGEDAYPSMWLKAAALCQSIDNNQALVDGNKRLAWLSTKVFLAINGQRLEAVADEVNVSCSTWSPDTLSYPPSPTGFTTTPATPKSPIYPMTQHDVTAVSIRQGAS